MCNFHYKKRNFHHGTGSARRADGPAEARKHIHDSHRGTGPLERRANATLHRLARRILGRERRARPGALFDRWYRGERRQPRLCCVGPIDADGLRAVLYLRRNRRFVPQQIGRRCHLRRGGLDSLFQVHRANLGLGQLDGLVAGSVTRLFDRRRLHSECRRADPCLDGDVARGRPLDGDACRRERRRRSHRGNRERHACDPHLVAVHAHAGPGSPFP